MKKNLLFIIVLLLATTGFSQPILEFLKITAEDRDTEDRYGWSVDISGEFAIVGAYADDYGASPNMGSAHIYQNTGEDEWTFVQKLFNSDQENYDRFGWSVAIDGETVVVGAYGEDDDADGEDNLSKAGSAYVFERGDDGIWVEVQKLVPTDRAAGDEFGWSVAVHGTTVVVGAHNDDKDEDGLGYMYHAGSAYVFDRDEDGEWTETQKIVASDRSPGFEFAPEHEDWNDRFGESVGIWNDYLIVGGPFASHAYMFEREGDVWDEVELLGFPGISWLDRAAPVSIDGTTCALGASTEDTDEFGLNYRKNAGGVAVFTRTGPGEWTFLQKLVAADRSAGDHVGISVSVDENYIVAGAHQDNHDKTTDNDLENAGSCYIYKLVGDTYAQYDKIDLSDREIEDQMGISISISDRTILVGAFQQDYNADGDDYFEDAGAAYFFKDLEDEACPTVFSSQSPSICDGETFEVDGDVYDESGTYSNTFTSVDGCDSIVTTYLTVITDDPFVYTIEICAGEVYEVGDSEYDETGTYTDVFATDAGCDSIVETNLIVLDGIPDNEIIDAGGGVLEATAEGGIYFEWAFCDPFEIIPFEPFFTYEPEVDGTYLVIAENELGCIDTSECFVYGDDGDAVILPIDGIAPTQTSCEGRLLDSGGSDGDYTDSEDSQITISPTGASVVHLDFEEFNVDGGADCVLDWMAVYDGDDLTDPLLGIYCNDNPPPATLSSTGGSVTIVFHSDAADVLSGFEVFWECEIEDPGDELTMPTDGAGPTQTDCEGTLFDSGGSLGDYGLSEEAQITISPTGASVVHLDFAEFNVDGGTDCVLDWMAVYDGDDLTDPLLGLYCNDNPPPALLSSAGGSVTIVFHSDAADVLSGFEVFWECEIDEPGDELTMPTDGTAETQTDCEGTLFDSGGSSDDYGVSEDAQITIAPTGATLVELTFVDFDVEGEADCSFDWLEVFDGDDVTDPSLGQFCNDNLPPATLTSTGGAVTIVFHSDDELVHEGFEIDWTCSEEIDDSGVDELSFDGIVSIYPNPATGQFNIDLSGTEMPLDLEIVNELGQIIYKTQLTDPNNQIDLAELAIGVYIVKLSSETALHTSRLLIINK